MTLQRRDINDLIHPFQVESHRNREALKMIKAANDASSEENKNNFYDLVNNISDGVFRINRAGRFTFVNRGMTDRSGIPPDKWLMLYFLDTVAPEDREGARENFEKVLNGQEVGPYELRYRTADARTLTVEINARPIYEGNEIIGVQGISRDLTERRKAEEAAKESEERFRSLFDRSLECIYVHDLEGWMIDANQAALDLLGYKREDLGTVNFASMLHPDQILDAMKEVESIRKGEIPNGMKSYKIRHKDGRFLELEPRGSLVYRDGRPSALRFMPWQ